MFILLKIQRVPVNAVGGDHGQIVPRHVEEARRHEVGLVQETVKAKHLLGKGNVKRKNVSVFSLLRIFVHLISKFKDDLNVQNSKLFYPW